ncbi:MAG: hypothetical protein IIT40_06915, partial [Prevotella sp.]|nr:hypothetical protein [Prevotella sp.]
MKSFPDVEIPYNVQPFNISNLEHVRNLMDHIQTKAALSPAGVVLGIVVTQVKPPAAAAAAPVVRV